MNKHENIYSLKGFGKVFKFTVTQTFKNKAYIVSFVMMVLLITLMGPINYLTSKSGADMSDNFDKLKGLTSEKIYILNETPVEFTEIKKEAFSDAKDGFKPENITIYQAGEKTEDELIQSLGSKESGVIISMGEEGFKVNGIVSDDTEVKTSEIGNITEFIKAQFDNTRVEKSNISQEDIQKISAGVDSDGVMSEGEYLDEVNKTVSGASYSSLMVGFSIIIFVVVTLATSYIIASVTEEKQSKLVESLLVSVRPMALLMGKVCGMLAYIMAILVCGFAGSKIADIVMRDVLKLDMSNYKSSGFDLSLLKGLSAGQIVMYVLTIIIGFLTFAVLGGLFGGACSKPEDNQNATGNVMIISFIGYFGASILGNMDTATYNHILAFVPPLSHFALPVLYTTGRIGLMEVIISYGIQIALLIGLILLSAKIYRTLLLSDSTTPKLKTIIKSIKM